MTYKKPDQSSEPVLNECSTGAASVDPLADSAERRKRELVGEMREANAEAAELGRDADDISRHLRWFRDTQEPAIDMIDALLASDLNEHDIAELRTQTRGFRYGVQSARQALAPAKQILWATSTATASASTSAIYVNVVTSIPTASPVIEPRVQQARERILANAKRLPLLGEAYQLLSRFGLDSSPYGRSAVEMLREAERALMVGAHDQQAIGAVLLGARNVIDEMTAALLRRRPAQGQTPNLADKVASLGEHFGLAALPADHFVNLGAQGARLHRELSQEMKQGALSRDALIVMFNQSVTWLVAVLQALDQARMKP
jgi:hypothetical protein